MSYATRVYRQRNPHSHADSGHTPFFNKAGNQQATAGKDNSFFQTKLSVGEPGDRYEREADAIAKRVVTRQPGKTPAVQQKEISSILSYATPLEDEKLATNEERMKRDKDIQRKPELQSKCAHCEKEEKEMTGAVQRKPGGGGTASNQLSGKIANSTGKGNRLPATTLARMNQSFGTDFSHVKIHTDSESIQLNRQLGAQAFTHGSDIYFNSGKFDAGSTTGKELLAHELTHVVQQGHAATGQVQRSCSDGRCETCSGGIRDFWITFYFRRRATARTMRYLRTQINETKRILANCCLNLKADFNWTLMAGGGHFDPLENPGGNWRYTNDASQLGTGAAFNGSRGIPVLVVDTVDDSGGGVTVTQNQTFDTAYSGRTYAVIGVNQVNPNPACNHLAHELWHVGSGEGHDIAHGTLAACQGDAVSPEFCTGLRNQVAPVGDFQVPATGSNSNNTAVA